MWGSQHTRTLDFCKEKASGKLSNSAAIPRRLRELFGVDLRSLAAFRVALGICVLADLATRAPGLVGLYTDDGVLPGRLLAAMEGRAVYLSAHYWTGAHPALQTLLFLLTAGCAVALLVGWRTRLATLACWYLVSSLQVRQPLVYIGGDSILRLLLFWGLFLPLSDRWSIDATRGRFPLRADLHFSGATVALLLQVCLIYWATGLQKTGELWWSGHAVSYALRADEWATPLGVALRDRATLLTVLTYATLAVELFGPFLAFIPVGTPAFRLAAVGLFWFFHIALAAMMNIGLFPLFAMAGWLPFVPGSTWRKLVPRAGDAHPSLADRQSWAMSLVALLVLTYVVALLAERTGIVPRFIPTSVQQVGKVLRVQQTWIMFAPNPPTNSARPELRLTLSDGTQVRMAAATSIRWTVYFYRFRQAPPPDDPLAHSLRLLARRHCRISNGPFSSVTRVAVVTYVRQLLPHGSTEPTARPLVDVVCD